MNLTVAELPQFHLSFPNQAHLEHWQRALLDLHSDAPVRSSAAGYEDKHTSDGDDDSEYRITKTTRRVSSVNSGYSGTQNGSRSIATMATEYSNATTRPTTRVARSLHIPLDIVVVIPVSSSMQGLKINLLRECLRFVVQSLGERPG